MSTVTLLVLLLAILGAALSWAVPHKRAMDAMAAWCLAVLATFSAPSAALLLFATTLTWIALRFGEAGRQRNLVAGLLVVALVGCLAAARLSHGIMWIGVSFFTLRLLHVAIDWWTARLPAPSLARLLRYQFFLPVLIVGPIHRFQTFERQVTRRRADAGDFLTGLERCLVGFVMAHFMGSVVMGQVILSAQVGLAGTDPLLASWALSALGWVRLYFVFAGLTSVALGASLMAGLRLEENFDKPWRATSLLDFWNRWHMSLTSWSRDYAYGPVMALTRSPLAGLVAAMLVIGLWHQFSLYYVCWSVWQVLGIVLSRIGGRLVPMQRLPLVVRAVTVPLAILAWLSAARPVLTLLLGVDYDADLSFS